MMGRLLVGTLLMAALGLQASAAVIVPVKAYAKPDEKVLVRFENEKGEEGKKALATLGLDATKLTELFAPAPDSELMVGNGAPTFELYTIDGKKLDFTAAKPEADGSVDLAAFFAQVKIPGTYVLVWKDATPLVIETLKNPVAWGLVMDEAKVPADKRSDAIKQLAGTEAVATHLVPLEYALITTDKGAIKATFAYDAAPHTVENFISLAKQKFYDGSAFHRVISGFMIQGGDSLANIEGKAGSGGPGYELSAEFNDKLHERGTLSMARTGYDVNTAGSQFFIMHAKTPSLDGQYTAFGDVIDGLDVVDAIAKTPVSDQNGTVAGVKPKIESVQILPATAAQYGIKK